MWIARTWHAAENVSVSCCPACSTLSHQRYDARVAIGNRTPILTSGRAGLCRSKVSARKACLYQFGWCSSAAQHEVGLSQSGCPVGLGRWKGGGQVNAASPGRTSPLSILGGDAALRAICGALCAHAIKRLPRRIKRTGSGWDRARGSGACGSCGTPCLLSRQQ